MTNTLTAEQIAQGWKPTSGRIALAYDEFPHPYQTTNFAGYVSPIFISGDSEPYWPEVVAYRTFSPDLPSPPVSGIDPKDVKGLCHKLRLMEQARVTGCFNPGLLFTNRMALDRLEAVVGATPLLDPPPLTNEPVGVMVNRDDLERVLRKIELIRENPCNTIGHRIIFSVREAAARLSAAIGEPRRSALEGET